MFSPGLLNLERLSALTMSDDDFGGNGNGRAAGGLTLSWRGLSVWGTRKLPSSFWEKTKYEKVQLIDQVNGFIKSGTLTAIMGPSGAGKTTLLAAVSQRVKGDISGELLLNGSPVSQKVLAGISGFVPQQDLAIESLTVKEHMMFMARMKMDRHTPEITRRKRIKELVREMGISKSFNTMISALSGGERKRLSLAVQLINDPPILFCDEPTTGLDSWAAASVVSSLRTLAASGRAVLCVLHQPASGTFQLFNRLMLLAGGRVAFMGPIDEARVFFCRQDLFCPVGYNEAEFFVNMVSTEERAKTVCKAWDYTERTTVIQDSALNGHHVLSNGYAVYKPSSNNLLCGEHLFEDYISIEKPGIFIQFYWLLWRNYLSAKNDKKIWVAEFISFMGIALLLAIPFQNVLATVNQQGIQNVQGLLYLIVTETIFMYIYGVFNHFPSEISIFLRELANGIYTPAPYYLSKMIIMIPRAIIEPLIYTTFIFWVVGLRGGFIGFLFFIVPVIFSANCANAYGTWLSATFESIATASLVSVPIDIIGYLLAGTFVNLSSLSYYIGWIRYLSVFFYSVEAISILQWETVDSIECDTRAGLPCINTGAGVLDYYGFKENNYFIDLTGLAAIYFGFHLFGFLALLKRSKKQPVY